MKTIYKILIAALIALLVSFIFGVTARELDVFSSSLNELVKATGSGFLIFNGIFAFFLGTLYPQRKDVV